MRYAFCVLDVGRLLQFAVAPHDQQFVDPEQQMAKQLVLRVLRDVGGPLLHAESLADFETQFDFLVCSREAQHSISEGLSAISRLGNGSGLPVPENTLRKLLGSSFSQFTKALRLHEQAERLWRAGSSTRHEFDEVLNLTPLDAFDEDAPPPEVMDLVFAVFRGPPNSFALGEAIIEARELPKWMQQRLAESAHAECYARLRLLASIGYPVPLSTVPEMDRLNLKALYAEIEEVYKRWGKGSVLLPRVILARLAERLRSGPRASPGLGEVRWPVISSLCNRAPAELLEGPWAFEALSLGAQLYLYWQGVVMLDEEDAAAELLWSHAVSQMAVLENPELADFVPLPESREILTRSATLGRKLTPPIQAERASQGMPFYRELRDVRQASQQNFVPWHELQEGSLSRRFQFIRLAVAWTQATGAMSSWSQKSEHETYKQILALGPAVIPDILRWLQQGGPGHWGHALALLTGERPKKVREAATVTELRQAWIDWGFLRGFLPQS
jgi:hypothetical protein